MIFRLIRKHITPAASDTHRPIFDCPDGLGFSPGREVELRPFNDHRQAKGPPFAPMIAILHNGLHDHATLVGATLPDRIDPIFAQGRL